MISKYDLRTVIAENKKLEKQLAQLKSSAAEIVLKYQEVKNELEKKNEEVINLQKLIAKPLNL